MSGNDATMRALARTDDPEARQHANRMRWRSCSACGGMGWDGEDLCECGAPPVGRGWDPVPEVERIDDPVPQDFLNRYRAWWLRIGLATGPTHVEGAKAGIRQAYEAAGLAPPEEWIWLSDPLQGAVAAAELARSRSQVWDQVRSQVAGQVRHQVEDQVRHHVRSQVGSRVWSQVGSQVAGQVGSQVEDQVEDQVESQVADQVWEQVWRACHGSHDAHWLGYYETWSRLGLRCADRLAGLTLAAQSCGWWWPFEGTVIVTDRPAVYEPGVRVVYPSGWEVSL